MELKDAHVCVHMAFYWRESTDEQTRNPIQRLLIIQKNIETCMKQWKVHHVDLFIYTNSEKAKCIEAQCPQTEQFRIHFLLYDFSYENPNLLVWKCRSVIETQKDKYDIFIYIEDDMGIPPQTLEYWWKWKDRLHQKSLDVGMLRVETLNNQHFFSSDITSSSAYLPFSIDNQEFVHLPMRYSGGWIADKQELHKFMQSDYWNFHLYYPKGIGYTGPHICESSAIGYKLSYKSTVYPIQNKKISPMCFIYHLSNTYIQKEGTSLGKLRVEDVTSNL